MNKSTAKKTNEPEKTHTNIPGCQRRRLKIRIRLRKMVSARKKRNQIYRKKTHFEENVHLVDFNIIITKKINTAMCIKCIPRNVAIGTNTK